MKKFLAVLALVAVSGSFAMADEKGTEFKFGGDMLNRFYYDNNPTFVGSNAVNENHFLMKNNLHLTAISGDKLQGFLNATHYQLWGGGSNGGAYATTGVGSPTTSNVMQSNALQISEAWMWWKVSDMFSLKTGRQYLTYGDGIVFAKNDWATTFNNTYAIVGRLSWDFLDLDLVGGKVADAGVVTPTTPSAPTVAAGGNTDFEVDQYMIYASIKNMPEVIKTVEVFVHQMNGDFGASYAFAPYAGTIATPWNLTSYGLHLKGDVAIIDWRADAVFQSGKAKGAVTATGTAQDLTTAGSMFDLEVGANFPEFMKGRVFVGYHQDSGNDSTNTTTSTSNNQYQPLFYDMHKYGGMMNMFGFGNLTAISAGLTLNPEEETQFGVEANMYSRTNDKGAPTVLTAAQGNMFTTPTLTAAQTGTANGGTNSNKSLGTEIDVWAKHNYGHGFNMMAGIGFFTVGDYFKPAGAVTTTTPSGGQSIGSGAQFVAQAQYMF